MIDGEAEMICKYCGLTTTSTITINIERKTKNQKTFKAENEFLPIRIFLENEILNPDEYEIIIKLKKDEE